MNLSYFIIPFMIVFGSCSEKKITATENNHERDYLYHLDYDYKYLNSQFDIIISKHVFDSLNHRRIPLNTYKDSLIVILDNEFKNDSDFNRALYKITWPWEKTGLYLWMSAKEAENLGVEMNLNHPYRLKAHFSELDNSPNEKSILFLNTLQNKIYNEIGEKISIYPTHDFLERAFILNPERTVLKEQFENSHNH